jgi:general secretion pathway protein E
MISTTVDSTSNEAGHAQQDPDALLLQAIKEVESNRWVTWLATQLQVPEQHALVMWAKFFSMRPMSRQELEQVQFDFEALSFAESQKRACALGWLNKGQTQEQLVFVVHDATDMATQQWVEALIERHAPGDLVRVLVRPDDFVSCLAGAGEGLKAMDGVYIAASGADATDTSNRLLLSLASIESTANPTVKLVDSTLYDALNQGASDIHFEVQHKTLDIKYRLDGVLQSIRRVDNLDIAHQAISRIKVLSDLDISEQRIPQDGRFRVVLDQRDIDFRVSIMPNISGEDAVLRILDRKHLTGQFESLTLDSLSFEAPVKSFIRRASNLPYGLLLVTGPTGSGKTTTLYAAISEINTGLDKIVTIEDPIEYQLSGVLQIPVNEKKGLTFAKGLRSILRHDPDKIMVGEIRDAETAHIAVQAALTGHQVFTTVHANNVFDVIGRFSNMGVDSYSLVAALTGIMAQRLVRTVCTQCATAQTLSRADLLNVFEPHQVEAMETRQLKKAVGCPLCRGTGYKGRIAITETLTIDDDLKDLLVKQVAISAVKRLARDKGFRSLRDSAVSLALQGRTTLEEINRVTPLQ